MYINTNLKIMFIHPFNLALTQINVRNAVNFPYNTTPVDC